jgi:hypothetical protein
MGRNADFVQATEQIFANALVEHTFAVDHGLLFRIKGGGIILKVDNYCAWLWTLIENLGLTFIYAGSPAVHGENPHRRPNCSTCLARRPHSPRRTYPVWIIALPLGLNVATHNNEYGLIMVDLPVAHGYLGSVNFDLE